MSAYDAAAQLAHVPVPTGATRVGEWTNGTGGMGRWVAACDKKIALGGYADEPVPGSVTVLALAHQRASGEVVHPYVHVESDLDHPMIPAEAEELITALGEAVANLNRLTEGARP